MRMSAIDAPKIVDQHVENTEQCNQKHSRVFCFESDCDHDTCEESEGADGNSTGTPTVALENEAEEEEDKEDSASELKVRSVRGGGVRKFRKSSKSDFATMKRIGQNHQQPANDT